MGEQLIGRLAAALGVVLLAGCTSAVTGTAAPADPAPPTAPGTTPGVIASPEPGEGTAVEALRIAGAATLIELQVPNRPFSCYPYGPADTAQEVQDVYFGAGDAVAPVLESAGFVVAWAQCRAASAQDATLIVIAELSDPATVQRVLPELVEATADPDQQQITLPGGAPARLTALGANEAVQAWVGRGRMVASVFHITAAGQGAEQAGLLVSDQSALLAGFEPTPQDRLGTLGFGRDGLRELVVDLPVDTLHRASGPYDLEGYLRSALDPVREREVLAANGFSGMYTRTTDPDAPGTAYTVGVFRFPTSVQTNAVYSAFAEVESATFEATPFTLPSIPEAPCFSFPARSGDGSFTQRCYVGFGSHLAYLDVGRLADPADVTEMDRLLPQQRDLIDG